MFFIRTDANPTIASGHVMRCLTIAEEIKKNGEGVTFLTADHFAEEMIKEKGFSVICLESRWNDLDYELPMLKKLIEQFGIKKLLVDSYYITQNYVKTLNQELTIIYLDDRAKAAYPVHRLINYGIQSCQMPYESLYAGGKTELLLGCRYVPVRSEFSRTACVIRENVRQILITTGGSDPYFAEGILTDDLLERPFFQKIHLHVILGRFNAFRNEMHLRQERDSRVTVYENIDSMSGIMAKCDLAVSAGGTTLYELCAVGLPTVCFTFADNQIPCACEMKSAGIIDYAGDIREYSQQVVRNVADSLERHCADRSLRGQRSSAMKALIDGRGAERIAKACVGRE